jgi:hypothetical protein
MDKLLAPSMIGDRIRPTQQQRRKQMMGIIMENETETQDSEKTPEEILLEVENLIMALRPSQVEETTMAGLTANVEIPSDDDDEEINLEQGSVESVSSNDDDDDDDDFEYPSVDEIHPIPLWAPEDTITDSKGFRKNILSIDVPRQMANNVKTGHLYLDRLMTGSGVTPSTACLVTGVPGSGKSTLMIQVSDLITSTGNVSIYNSNEESDVQLSRVVNRLRLKHGFEITSYENVFDVVEHALRVQEELHEEYLEKFNTMKENGASAKQLFKLRPRQVFLTLDSLQTLEMPHWEWDPKTGRVIRDSHGEPVKKIGRPPQGDNMHLNIAHYLSAAWCKRTYGIMFLIGQVTKNGEFAGKQGIKHWVDAHLHLDIDRDKKSDTYNDRVAEMTKNRFGPAGLYYAFEIEARGIKFKNPHNE